MAVKAAATASVAPAKDWSYLVDKAPSELHVDLAAYVFEETGLNLDEVPPAKAAQLIVAMHGTWQKTDRVARRRRTVESIAKGGATTAIARGWAPDDLLVEAPKEEPVAVEKKPTRRRAAAKKEEAVAAK